MDFERLVLEVIERLRERGVAIASSEPHSSRLPGGSLEHSSRLPGGSYAATEQDSRETLPPGKREPHEKEACCSIPDRVVTLAVVEGKLDGIRSIGIRKGAVVTPSVRDLLRERRIAIRVGTSPAGSGAVAGLIAFAMSSGEAHDPAPGLPLERVDSVAGERLGGTVGRLSRRLMETRRLGVLVTDRPAIAICLANHLVGIRAVCESACDETMVELGANFLVVGPKCGSPARRRKIERFLELGWRDCPEKLRDFLAPP